MSTASWGPGLARILPPSLPLDARLGLLLTVARVGKSGFYERLDGTVYVVDPRKQAPVALPDDHPAAAAVVQVLDRGLDGTAPSDWLEEGTLQLTLPRWTGPRQLQALHPALDGLTAGDHGQLAQVAQESVELAEDVGDPDRIAAVSRLYHAVRHAQDARIAFTLATAPADGPAPDGPAS